MKNFVSLYGWYEKFTSLICRAFQDEEDSRHAQREIVSSILHTQGTLDEKMRHSELRLFSNAAPITGDEIL